VHLPCKKKVVAFFLPFEGCLEFFAVFQTFKMFVHFFHDFLRNRLPEALLSSVSLKAEIMNLHAAIEPPFDCSVDDR